MDQHLYSRCPRRKRQKREEAEKLFEIIMAENFLNLGKETDIQIQEA